MIKNTCEHFDCWHDIGNTGTTYTDWCLLKGNLTCDNCEYYKRNIEEEQ